MHDASINEEVTEANMHKKGFIDMVKGLLAWFIRVLRSSGPSPSTPSTSSTNVETIIISNTTRQKIKVL